MLAHCQMTLVCFLLFRKNLGNLREFFGQMVHRPPWQKTARTPMARIRIRLCSDIVLFITGKENFCFFYERKEHKFHFAFSHRCICKRLRM